MGKTLYSSAAAAAAAVVMFYSPSVIPEPQRTDGDRAGSCSAGTAGAPRACPGTAIRPDRVITVRSYVMLPFHVPRGTTAVRVKYCHDQPNVPVSTPLASARHTLDLGLYGPRRARSRP